MRTGPDYIQFYPTLRCNKSCDFCFNRTMPGMADMALPAFERLLQALKQASVKTIDIMGGEPTLHPGIVAMVQQAAQLGFFVNVSSNGSNLDALEELMDLGRQVSVGISINDHETLAPASSFIKARRPVVKTVYTPSVDLTLIRSILAHAPGKFYLIYRDALEKFELNECIPFPRFQQVVNSEFGRFQAGMVFCSGFIAAENSSPDLHQVRCPAGTTKLGVMPDGSVYPCNLFFGRKEFLLGNLLSDSFETIWSNPRLAWFRFRTDNPCAASSCPHHGACHGGCPAQSLLLAGSLSAPDPRCNLV